MYNLSDTITSICTPTGKGAIAAIRVSGEKSWEIARKIFCLSSNRNNPYKDLDLQHMKAVYGFIKDEKGIIIDEVILLPFKSPNSFTTEDVIEIFCHGGIRIPGLILDVTMSHGARKAHNGEFTFRAFVNGRIDLTEAEAVNELINADSEKFIYSASNVLSGALKNKIAEFREKLFDLITSIESSIEFPSDVPSVNKDFIAEKLNEINSEINSLIESSKEGQILRNGIKVSIVGLPNAGKSSLLNQLLENQRAIVSEEPGTTRDTIEEKIIVEGYPIVLIDTAGIREKFVSDSEKMGIERSKRAIESSDIVMLVYDLAAETDSSINEITSSLSNKTKIIIGNKLDLVNGDMKNCDIAISAKYGKNIDKLKKLILEKVNLSSSASQSLIPIYINQRQKELLLQCYSSVKQAIDTADKNISDDLISDELKKAVSKLDEISGRVINETVIQNIFAKFCIVK